MPSISTTADLFENQRCQMSGTGPPQQVFLRKKCITTGTNRTVTLFKSVGPQSHFQVDSSTEKSPIGHCVMFG